MKRKFSSLSLNVNKFMLIKRCFFILITFLRFQCFSLELLGEDKTILDAFFQIMLEDSDRQSQFLNNKPFLR